MAGKAATRTDEKARQLNAWIISQRAHAVANGLPVISVNRVGHEPDPSGQTNGILFWGNSFVAGPQGEFLAQAGNDHPENIVVEIDMERSENVRRCGLSFVIVGLTNMMGLPNAFWIKDLPTYLHRRRFI